MKKRFYITEDVSNNYLGINWNSYSIPKVGDIIDLNGCRALVIGIVTKKDSFGTLGFEIKVEYLDLLTSLKNE